MCPETPNLFSAPLTIQYTASSGLFTVSASTSAYHTQGGDSLPVTDASSWGVGTFDLSANIATNGNLLSGTVTIEGAVYDQSYDEPPLISYGTLLQGNLTAFGYQTNGVDQFDFLFNVTGGELADVYGSVGGIYLNTEEKTSFAGNFLTDFSTSGSQGDADTKMVIPEPEPQLLVVLSVLGLWWGARWRARLRKG